MAIEHVRHKEMTKLDSPRELILACPPFKSGVNLSRIVRLAGCAGIRTIYACGATKIDAKVARDALEHVEVIRRRTLASVLKQLKQDNYRLVALEQTTESSCIFDFQFETRTALVIGHERHGLSNEELAVVDDAIEIPVYGLPFSYNVVTATTMAVYEYCRQFPS